MRYRVYDTNGNKFITDDRLFLKPDGKLAIINNKGEEIALSYNHSILFYPTDLNDNWIDEIGGVHDTGTGYTPDGRFCGECSNISCRFCSVWDPTKPSVPTVEEIEAKDLKIKKEEQETKEEAFERRRADNLYRAYLYNYLHDMFG